MLNCNNKNSVVFKLIYNSIFMKYQLAKFLSTKLRNDSAK